MHDQRVLGVDACRTGWVGIVLSGAELSGAVPSAWFAADIAELAGAAGRDGTLDVVAIDMPIGLPDSSRRAADVLARKAVGPRWASAFLTPVRTALMYDDYGMAAAESRRAVGEGLSRQAFALRHKIMQVDRWIRGTDVTEGTDLHVVEIHPEVSFARLAGGHIRHPKSTWAGAAARKRLLAAAGIRLADDLGAAGEHAGVADILDAAAAAWTARRVALGQAGTLPDPPESFSDGLRAAIWT